MQCSCFLAIHYVSLGRSLDQIGPPWGIAGQHNFPPRGCSTNLIRRPSALHNCIPAQFWARSFACPVAERQRSKSPGALTQSASLARQMETESRGAVGARRAGRVLCTMGFSSSDRVPSLFVGTQVLIPSVVPSTASNRSCTWDQLGDPSPCGSTGRIERSMNWKE